MTIESYIFYENRFSYFKLFANYLTNQITSDNFMLEFLKLRVQNIETVLNFNSESFDSTFLELNQSKIENFSSLILLTFEEIEFHGTDVDLYFEFRKNIQKIYTELKKYFD